MLFLADAFENARNLCDRYYMNSPELVLEEFNGDTETNPRDWLAGSTIAADGFSSFVCCHSGRKGAHRGGLRPISSLPHGVRALQGGVDLQALCT